MFLSFRVSKSSQRVTFNQITNYPPEDISAALEPANTPLRTPSRSRSRSSGSRFGWPERSFQAVVCIYCRRKSHFRLRKRPNRHDCARRSERQGKAGDDSSSSNLRGKRNAANAVLLAREIQPRKCTKALEPTGPAGHNFGRDDCYLAFFRFRS